MTTNDARDAHLYRLAVARKILRLFEEANGHPARSPAELDEWHRSGGFRRAAAYDLTPDRKVIPDREDFEGAA